MAGLDTTFLNNVTREHFLPVLKNNIYKKMPLMTKLMTGGNVRPAKGRSLIWDVILRRATSVGTWTGYNPVATQPTNPTVQASMNWSNYYGTIAISLQEEMQNSGDMQKEKLLDMLEIQFKNVESSLKEKMYQDLYLGNTTVGGDYVLVGLQAIVSASNTYAGINRATAGNSDWQAQVNSTAHTIANLKDPTSTSYLPSIMRTSWLNASFDNSPDLIVTTPTIYELYQYIAETHNLQFDNSMANLGFYNGAKLGSVEMIFDKYCTSYYIYFLTTKNFQTFIFDGANFDIPSEGAGSWVSGVGQLARSCQVIWMGQIICDVPRENAVCSNVGAS
jgi:hypothetical protein